MPPPMFSSMCAGLVVPGRATVTAGWLMTYLRKNCAHVFASKSAAHSGRGVLLARSETRFQDPRGPFFEFQLDGQGKVTGAILEQGEQRIPLERK